MKQRKHFCIALTFLLSFCVVLSSNAQELTTREFSALLAQDNKAPVIIVLKSAPNTQSASRNIGGGEWVSLGDYIEEAQQKLSQDMGWVNFNDIVKYKHVAAMAKSVSADEFAQLAQSNLVQGVYPDRFNELLLTRSARTIGFSAIEQRESGGSGYSVAVIDSGVEAAHPFFQGRVVDGACFSRLGSCVNGQTKALGVSAGRPCNGADGCFHGTHVAGIVAGKNNNMSGVAPKADILALNVFSVVGDRIGAADSDIMQALEWVYENRNKHNVASVNMSLGGGFFTQTCDNAPTTRLINLLRQEGIITVIAAGNEGKINGVAQPGCVSSALTIGSLEPDGNISGFSNSYGALDMVAPGGKIHSSVLGGQYGTASGTSMAAPQVAGAVALLKSFFPQASGNDIFTALTKGTPFTDPRNNVTTPQLFLTSSLAWLASKYANTPPRQRPTPPPTPAPSPPSRPAPSPEPPADRPVDQPENSECKPKRIDGILIENDSSECKRSEGKIEW